MTNDRLFPVQRPGPRDWSGGKIRECVYMAAYEVYAHVHGPQEAMIDLDGRGCRGGFSAGELIAFLYARKFPMTEWRARVDEALKGMQNI